MEPMTCTDGWWSVFHQLSKFQSFSDSAHRLTSSLALAQGARALEGLAPTFILRAFHREIAVELPEIRSCRCRHRRVQNKYDGDNDNDIDWHCDSDDSFDSVDCSLPRYLSSSWAAKIESGSTPQAVAAQIHSATVCLLSSHKETVGRLCIPSVLVFSTRGFGPSSDFRCIKLWSEKQ